MTRPIVVFALSLFISVPLFAGLSAKYKEWPSTPQGMFMTSAERAQWATVTTDADAETFIQQFLAARGGGFPAEVAKRTEMADKYLTVGKTPGSKTLRGKVIILLGPPTSMDVTQSEEGEGRKGTSAFSEAMTKQQAANPAGAMHVNDDVGMGIGGGLQATKLKRYYSFTFQNELAKKLDQKAIVVKIVADGQDGRDQLVTRSDAPELEKAFEKAAEMSVLK